jgi:hypothetical protein
MGCYPIFACQDWSQLHLDLKGLDGELVSLAVVTDPFGDYSLTYLQRCFDLVTKFKEHFVADLSRPVNAIVSKHHRYYARRALQNVQVERCSAPRDWLDDWLELYATLVERHNITGIQAFSHEAFAKQLNTPGMVMFRGVSQGKTVGANLFFINGDVAYAHLSAYNPYGYELRASYAIRWTAMQYLSHRVRWLNLGAGAGIRNSSTNGLSGFKQGWSTGTRPAYFCGRIFDQKKYAEITRLGGIPANGYFPAYRSGEFN